MAGKKALHNHIVSPSLISEHETKLGALPLSNLVLLNFAWQHIRGISEDSTGLEPSKVASVLGFEGSLDEGGKCFSFFSLPAAFLNEGEASAGAGAQRRHVTTAAEQDVV